MLKVAMPRSVWSQRVLLLMGVAFFLGVFYLDWKTDPAISWLVFYLVPLGLVTWYFGKWFGAAAALGAALLGLQLDLWQKSNLSGEIQAWNGLVRLLTFSVTVALVYTCRVLLAEVAKQTAARMASLEAELAARQLAANASRQLAQEVTRAEIAERRRLAHDLHDSFGQELTALKMALQRTCNVLADGTAERTQVDAACQQVSRLIEQTRQMTFELHPATLDDFGLVPTLKHYAEQYGSQTGLEITIAETPSAAGEGGKDAAGRLTLTRDVRTVLFRAIKELMNNAAKHGPARQVVVRFNWSQAELRIVVDDDGRGFEVAPATSITSGLGHRWIRERLAGMGGELLLESVPGSGARAIIIVPRAALNAAKESA